ncbi:MAG: thrombospondin type 3 repeat-containing protein [Clostridia bacterium]|nr:thrombospondin type 3 repeat-containing protein [Clostridia bacterium]
MKKFGFLASTFLAAQVFSATAVFSAEAPRPPEDDMAAPYYDRHKIDIANLRDFYDGILMSDAIIHADAMFDAETKWKLTLRQMILTGSNHHQARSAYQLSLMSVPVGDILAIWSPDYVGSLKDDRLRVAFEYIEAISRRPADVTADTHAALRTHYIDRQIAELFELAGVNAMNVMHDSLLPIATDQETLDWARENLGPVGWKPGSNAAQSPEEQRARPFVGDALDAAYKEVISAWKPDDLAAIDPEFTTDWINHVTGYDVSRITFDGDKDGVEEPFDHYPEEYLRWEDPAADDANLPPASTPPFNAAAYDYPYYSPPIVPETKYPFSDRNKFDTEWTRQASLGTQKIETYFSYDDRALPLEEKWPIFFVYQLASGCVHCQSHGAFGYFDAVEDDYPYDNIPDEDLPRVIARIHALFDFERSDLFTDAQKAAYRFARDAGKLPARTTSAHIEELRRHYSDREIQEIMTVLIAGAWLSSDMQSQVTVTDQLAMSWALKNLTSVGWRPGAHVGWPNEQRAYHMTEMADYAYAKMSSGDVIDQVSEWLASDVPLGVDTDNDGVEDDYDGFPTDPTRWADTDQDGREDSKDNDIDGDGISNRKEVSIGTFPYKADSDGDGVIDPVEIEAGTDPVDPHEF